MRGLVTTRTPFGSSRVAAAQPELGRVLRFDSSSQLSLLDGAYGVVETRRDVAPESRVRFPLSSPSLLDGGHGVVVTRLPVAQESRVRFPLITPNFQMARLKWGSMSMVARMLCKQPAAGSIPVTSTILG